jgi:hypothetical protein
MKPKNQTCNESETEAYESLLHSTGRMNVGHQNEMSKVTLMDKNVFSFYAG